MALGYFYGTIRTMVNSFIGGMFGLPVDIVLLGIGVWKSKEWWGETLAISAATALGLNQNILFTIKPQGYMPPHQTQQTPRPPQYQPESAQGFMQGNPWIVVKRRYGEILA